VVRDDIFPVLWQFLKNAASPLAGEPQNQEGPVSPPQAAKNVRANLRIVHHFGYVKLSASPLRGSAAKLNGIFQLKYNFWFCLPANAGR
jgi:hypothetical protein